MIGSADPMNGQRRRIESENPTDDLPDIGPHRSAGVPRRVGFGGAIQAGKVSRRGGRAGGTIGQTALLESTAAILGTPLPEEQMQALKQRFGHLDGSVLWPG